MSNNEIGKLNGPIGMFTFVLAAGALAAIDAGSIGAKLTPNSRLLGVVRNTLVGAGVTYSTPLTVAVAAPANAAAILAGTTQITATSGVNTDTSNCTLYWCNETVTPILDPVTGLNKVISC